MMRIEGSGRHFTKRCMLLQPRSYDFDEMMISLSFDLIAPAFVEFSSSRKAL
jgi:hypothetical protein